MIKYDAGTLGVLFILRINGSVFPKAMLWAVPNAILGLVLHMYCRSEQVAGNPLSMDGVNLLWGGYTSVLGFLVVFRNNQAYTRFWEGATLINQVRGEWFNAVSTLFAFCNSAPEVREKVDTFQQTLIRLASMLYCSALQQVCVLDDNNLEIIEIVGMDQDSMSYMQLSNDRCEVLLQWIQRLIVEAQEETTIKIAPPLLTRAFQEFSRGIVNLNNARKIKDIPFPFPYAQMITCMLIVHWVVTPILASQVIESPVAAAFVCFFVTLSFWCLIYIALEIDQPFGEDANDLPLRDMQKDFNQSLLNLLHPLAQKVPTYKPPSGLDRVTLAQIYGVVEEVSDESEDDVVVSDPGPTVPAMGPCKSTKSIKQTMTAVRSTATGTGEKMRWGDMSSRSQLLKSQIIGEADPASRATSSNAAKKTTIEGEGGPSENSNSKQRSGEANLPSVTEKPCADSPSTNESIVATPGKAAPKETTCGSQQDLQSRHGRQGSAPAAVAVYYANLEEVSF